MCVPAMVQANPIDDIAIAAQTAFDQMPIVRRVAQMDGQCGADGSVNDQVAYCTTNNVIFITHDSARLPQAA